MAVVASFVPLFVVTVGASLAAATAADRVALETDLAKQRAQMTRTAARVQAVLGHEQRRMARSLHADVQSAVNAAGLMLDRSYRQGAVTSELVDDVVTRIATSVERFLAGGASDLPLTARLSEVRALWAGVCTVLLAVDEAAGERIDADAVTRELVVDLVTEACANAVVHGDAREVRVRLALVGEEVELEVSDDGTRGWADSAAEGGPPGGVGGATPRATPRATSGAAHGGLGTQVLRASCTSFSLVVGERGSRLHALLPLG
jgi:signal transduction histidine kinase